MYSNLLLKAVLSSTQDQGGWGLFNWVLTTSKDRDSTASLANLLLRTASMKRLFHLQREPPKLHSVITLSCYIVSLYRTVCLYRLCNPLSNSFKQLWDPSPYPPRCQTHKVSSLLTDHGQFLHTPLELAGRGGHETGAAFEVQPHRHCPGRCGNFPPSAVCSPLRGAEYVVCFLLFALLVHIQLDIAIIPSSFSAGQLLIQLIFSMRSPYPCSWI